MRKVFLAILFATLLLAGGFHVLAQETARAEIIKVDPSSFPTITALLDVYDAQGKFVTDLDAANVTVLEDGQPLPLSELTEEEVGVQLVVAINPGPPMAVRDKLGISRYERVVEVLRLWAEARPLEPQDEMSLVTTTGPLLIGATPSEWHNSFVSFQPDARAAVPSLESLSLALDVLEGQQDSPTGMKHSILFLTPHLPDQSTVDKLENLAQRAATLGARVNVWLIDSEAYFVHFSATSLKSLAFQTGGEFFAYSGVETLPDPEIYFAHLRHLYTLKYESQLATGGTHNLAAWVQSGELDLLSEEQSFALDIQPPNPMLLSPPAQIVRQAPEDDPYNIDLLQPTEQVIEILIEFPDGHPRPIINATLFVDDEIVSVITEPPFDKFHWNISEYLSSGEHSLRIEVEDSLGLIKTSLGVPVTLTVVQPPTGALAFFGRNSSNLTIGVIALAGILLALILLAGGRRGLFTFAIARREAKKASSDPLTQPVPAITDDPKNNLQSSAQGWGRRPKRVKASAYLARLNGGSKNVAIKRIPLTGEEITFGTDPVKAAYVLDDPSISPIHARINPGEGGRFIISDQDSVAGTWVNFEQIGSEGAVLAHGDLIHFGALRYQFIVEKPPNQKKPEISIEKGL